MDLASKNGQTCECVYAICLSKQACRKLLIHLTRFPFRTISVNLRNGNVGCRSLPFYGCVNASNTCDRYGYEYKRKAKSYVTETLSLIPIQAISAHKYLNTSVELAIVSLEDYLKTHKERQ
jgi:hypothetical protein